MRDLVVAGGGPVGLAAALHAARAGLDVVVREPRTGPVDKACGEGLMPGAVAELATLGVHPDGHPLAGIRYVDGSGRGAAAEAVFRAGPGRGVRRTTLHAALCATRSARAGVPVEPAPVRVGPATRATTCSSTGSRPATWSPPTACTRPYAACSASRRPRAGRVGSACAATSSRRPWTPFVEVHWAPRAEAYVTPVADDLVGVALLTDSGAPFDELLAGVPAAAGAADGRAHARCMGAGPLRQRVAAPGRPAGCCWSATPAATSTRSPARASPSGWPRPARPWRRVAADDPERYERAGAPAQPAPRAAHPRPARAPPRTARRAPDLVPAAARAALALLGRRQPARPTDRGARMTSIQPRPRPSRWCCSTRRATPSAPPTSAPCTTRTPRCTWRSPATSSTARARSWSPGGRCTSRPGRGCGPTAAAATRRRARTLADAVRRRVGQELGVRVDGPAAAAAALPLPRGDGRRHGRARDVPGLRRHHRRRACAPTRPRSRRSRWEPWDGVPRPACSTAAGTSPPGAASRSPSSRPTRCAAPAASYDDLPPAARGQSPAG